VCSTEASVPVISHGNGFYKPVICWVDEISDMFLLMANYISLIQGGNKPQPTPECVLPPPDTRLINTAGEPFLGS